MPPLNVAIVDIIPCQILILKPWYSITNFAPKHQKCDSQTHLWTNIAAEFIKILVLVMYFLLFQGLTTQSVTGIN